MHAVLENLVTCETQEDIFILCIEIKKKEKGTKGTC